ncbi:MgtC/SapB family protein [Methyloglobulus sp.]
MVAALIGGLIGCERERHASDAGIRTYMAISIRCLCILFDIRPCGE